MIPKRFVCQIVDFSCNNNTYYGSAQRVVNDPSHISGHLLNLVKFSFKSLIFI